MLIMHMQLCIAETRPDCTIPIFYYDSLALSHKKHLKNVGPIRHCEPPHPHSPGVASGTVARRLRINVHDNDDNDNDNA